MLTESEWNYINFAFRDMEFPIPVICGRRKREPEEETSDGYGTVAIKPKI